ncbi:cyclase family protein [Candidatus Magnetoovum chiemensis]|nr:cyclase family protein [Candidatus Magnetoovum chiemensis]
MLNHSAIYDISLLLGKEAIDYPGDTKYERLLISSIEDGSPYNLSKLIMSAHSGTHIDAPSHFIQGKRHIDQYELGNFILPALVVHINDNEAVKPSELKNQNIRENDALLFKTNNSRSKKSVRDALLSREYVYITAEAAQFCVNKKVALVGLDYITIDKYGDDEFPSHKTLMGNDILVLEGINLEHVPEGRYRLICLPLRLKDSEASPVRAVLIS